MMERVEVTITIAEGETAGSVQTGYTSGLVEGVYVATESEAEATDITVTAIEPFSSKNRTVLSAAPFSGDTAFYPRTPVTLPDGATPVEYATDLPVAERAPVYGTLQIDISGAVAGDIFNVAIYLSNANPNGR